MKIIRKADISIPLESAYQDIRFIIGIKRHFFHSCHSIFIDAHINFGSKFGWCLCLPPDNWSNIRLTQTDNAIWNAVFLFFVHGFLLFEYDSDHSKPVCILYPQNFAFLQISVNVSKITLDVIELLFDCLTDFWPGSLLAFCKVQVIFSGFVSICSRLLYFVVMADRINHFFKIFS